MSHFNEDKMGSPFDAKQKTLVEFINESGKHVVHSSSFGLSSICDDHLKISTETGLPIDNHETQSHDSREPSNCNQLSDCNQSEKVQ